MKPQKLMAGVSKLRGRCGARSGRAGRNALSTRAGAAPPSPRTASRRRGNRAAGPLREHGAQLVKEAASKTSDVAGDGTTTATISPRRSIAKPQVDSAGADPMALNPRRAEGRREGRRGAQEARREGRRQGRQGDHEVATIAANNNPEIGAKLAEAMKLVGASNGVITVEEGKTAETEVVVVQGMQFDRGYLSPHFVTNQDQMICELDNPYILIYEEKIGSAKNLIPLLETISKKKEPLLIIAEDIEGDALATLVVNKLKGILQVCAVKAPGYGDRRKAMLEDIARSPAQGIFKDLGIQLENVKLTDLGRPRRSASTPRTRTITEGAGDKKAIDGPLEIDSPRDRHDRQRSTTARSCRSGGEAGGRVAQIKVWRRNRDRNEGTQGAL